VVAGHRDDGLLVVGVPHAGVLVRARHRRHYGRRWRCGTSTNPIAQDNDYAAWSAFANHYWPALYFVDADGVIRDKHFGEGRYDESERVIQRLLGVERELVSVEGVGVEAPADWDHLQTPETYLGYGRSEQFASVDDAAFDQRGQLRAPAGPGPQPLGARRRVDDRA
jgi:hypothetical protein